MLIAHVKSFISRFIEFINKARQRNVIIFVIALIGVITLTISAASTTSIQVELENGSICECARSINDPTASAGQAVVFGCTGLSTYGASLPIQYDLTSITGTIKYVAPNGNDSNDGNINTPYATLSKAQSSVSSGGTIVMRGGIYRNMVNQAISKTVKIIAYPGEIPEIRGSIQIPSATNNGDGWNIEGNTRWRDYRPRPLTDGSGITFSTEMTNLTGEGEGRYPDQVWLSDTSLKQVVKQDKVKDGSFFVDASRNRIYLSLNDATKPNIEISRPSPAGSTNDRDRAIYISGQNITLEGIRVKRYSNGPNDYGVITVESGAHNVKMKNVEVSDSAFITIFIGGVDSPIIENVTLDRSNWMGFSVNQTDNLVLRSVKVTNMNSANEFSGSPQGGALKTSRTKGTKVIDSLITNNNSHGLWYDESNTDVLIANTKITDNTQSGVFFEISDGMLMVNNYVRSSGSREPVQVAGSSGVRLVNNTLVGGANPLAVYTDDRSQPNCSNSTFPLSACGNGNTSVLKGNRMSEPNPNPPPEFLARGDGAGHSRSGFARRKTIDWMPRIDLMINNILAYPTSSRFCGITVMCITTNHSSSGAIAPLNTILHQKNSPWQNIQQTLMNGNVYATNDGNGILIRVQGATSKNYQKLDNFRTEMSASPVSIPNIEINGLYGSEYVNSNGSPSSILSQRHNNAVAVPEDSTINQYIPVGTKFYGVNYDISKF